MNRILHGQALNGGQCRTRTCDLLLVRTKSQSLPRLSHDPHHSSDLGGVCLRVDHRGRRCSVARKITMCELSERGTGCFVVCSRCLHFAGELSEVHSLSVDAYSCFPLPGVPVPANALELRGAAQLALVALILAAHTLAQVLALIVETVVVLMIYLHLRVGDTLNEPVHPELLARLALHTRECGCRIHTV